MNHIDFNEVVQPGHEVLDFVQCQRSDGTIYGSRGGCEQKGAKEVTSNKGGEGGGGNNTNEQLSSDSKAKLGKLGTLALRDVMDQVSKKATMAQSDKAKAVIEEAYKLHSAIEKAEGKTPMTITSIIPGATLKKLGINPNKANVSVKAKPSGPKAVSLTKAMSSTNKKFDAVAAEFDSFLASKLPKEKMAKMARAMSEQGKKSKKAIESAPNNLAKNEEVLFTMGWMAGIRDEFAEENGLANTPESKKFKKEADALGKAMTKKAEAEWNAADSKTSAEAKAFYSKTRAEGKAKSKAEAEAKPKAKAKPKARYTAASATQEINDMAKKYARFVKEGKLTAKEASEDLDRQAHYLSKESGNAISVRELRTTGKSTLVIATLQRLKKK